MERGQPVKLGEERRMKESKLSVEKPCEKRWAELVGDGEKRHCEACALHVIDGSALTRTQAEDVAREASAAGERVCMRMLVDESGSFVHAEDRPVSRGLGWKAGAILASGALVACGDKPVDEATVRPPSPHETPSTEPQPERPPEIMGAVCYVEEPGEAHQPDETAAEGESPSERPAAELSEIMGRTRVVPEQALDPE